MENLSYLKNVDAVYLEGLREQWLADPESVDPSWRYFFDGTAIGEELASARDLSPAGTPAREPVSSEVKVADLIHAYRSFGRHLAKLDPLSAPPESHSALELSRFGLSESDLARIFTAGRQIGMESASLGDIIARLKEVYCGSIGVEFEHISERAERQWLQDAMEATRGREKLDPETRKFILKRLTRSEGFERFLHTRYVAQKRFSVEGGEAVIPALDCLIETSAALGAEQLVLGMAHRGRLNVLANIMGKPAEVIFTEFEGNYTVDTTAGEGDVKYHMGYSADVTTRRGQRVHLALASNPSHLEFVNPVIEGIVRAKQTLLGDRERRKVVPVAIHGDAAFAGQGVCYETLNLSRLQGYGTGGTLHIMINNQIGFTALPSESRSTPYATDLAKMLEAPIFHVNGDDPEAVWFVSRLAAEFRHQFGKDVFIDLICYRRHGHNEGDEPAFTQPLMYAKIRSQGTTRDLYARVLASDGVLRADEAEAWSAELVEEYRAAQALAKKDAPHPAVSAFTGQWEGFHATSQREGDPEMFKPVPTAVPAERLQGLAEKLNRVPETFHLHPKLVRFLDSRLRNVQDGKSIDWGNGETLAYASLLTEGYTVRLSGQDSERGTFTHRHAVLNDTIDGTKYIPLNQLSPEQARFQVYNSHLSESGVLGFEYGYSLTDPRALVVWEAQFGDFANGAQVIIDQFIASSESKWQRASGLVLLLPHGFEGQGPEHSSGRIERFLQLCGRNNLAVCNLSTPAQFFHALRRQMLRDFRKPLVVFTPKSLLRHPRAVSDLEAFSRGRFQEILDDPHVEEPGKIRKIIFCTGKVYYDLLVEREAREISDIALVRIEQLYPWPTAGLSAILKRYARAREIQWVQEEPRNMGAWSYVFGAWAGGSSDQGMEAAGGRPIAYVGRALAAAPAVGSAKVHDREQKAILDAALGRKGDER